MTAQPRRIGAVIGVVGVMLALTGSAHAASGDIVVSDPLAFGANNGGLIGVAPFGGARSTLSENLSPVGGPDFESPAGVTFDAGGDILVADPWTVGAVRRPGIVRVDPATGARTRISRNTAPAGGPLFSQPNGIAVEASGDIVVADLTAFGGGQGGLIRVDPATGARTLISRNGSPAGNPAFVNPWDVAVEASGDLIVVQDTAAGGEVLRVDPATGARTLLSANGNPGGGPSFDWPWGLAIEANGDILVSDKQAGGGAGAIIRVDPVSGARSLVSKNTNPAGGPSFTSPADLSLDAAGRIFVADQGPSGTGLDGSVIEVDPVSGVRSTVSTNGAPAGGPDFYWPWGIAIQP